MKGNMFTTQRQIIGAFWREFPQFRKTVVPLGNGLYRERTQNEYPCDVRCAFVDFVDALQKSGQISAALAERVTL